MKIRTTILLLMITALLTISLSSLLGQPTAETTGPEQKTWSHLQVFADSYGNRLGSEKITGFFDTKNGKLYYYDSRGQIVKVRQIDELGAPLKRVVIDKNKLTEKAVR